MAIWEEIKSVPPGSLAAWLITFPSYFTRVEVLHYCLLEIGGSIVKVVSWPGNRCPLALSDSRFHYQREGIGLEDLIWTQLPFCHSQKKGFSLQVVIFGLGWEMTKECFPSYILQCFFLYHVIVGKMVSHSAYLTLVQKTWNISICSNQVSPSGGGCMSCSATLSLHTSLAILKLCAISRREASLIYPPQIFFFHLIKEQKHSQQGAEPQVNKEQCCQRSRGTILKNKNCIDLWKITALKDWLKYAHHHSFTMLYHTNRCYIWKSYKT